MIDLLPDADQQALADAFAEVLENEASLARLRTAGAAGERSLVRRLAELGWMGLAVAEADGGLGLGIVEELLLMRAAGRHLVGTTLLATLLAATIDDDSRAALLAGNRLAALAIATPDGTLRLDHAEDDLTVAIGADGAVRLGEDGVFVPTVSIDDAVSLEKGLPAEGPAVDQRLRTTLLAAAYLTGLAERARDMAVDYAKIREQFGQPIGAFQAIKHRCADMAAGCEAAWSLAVFAALALTEGRSDAAFQVEAARIVAGDAATAAAHGNVQVHGGIGFTAECDAQLLVKRLQIWLQIAGPTREHRHRLMVEAPPR